MSFSFAHLPKPLLLLLLLFTPPLLPEVSALQGDSWCGTLMCVTAIVNASTVTYELKALNQLGWMAIGFGSHMANSPMVILWQRANGTILSQRQASGRIEPLPVTHPPRGATIYSRASSAPAGGTTTLAFNIMRNNDKFQSLIWAFGVTIPDPDPSADIEQHLDAGTLSLNLTKELDVAGEKSSDASMSIAQPSGSPATSAPSESLPLPVSSQSSPPEPTPSRTNSLLVLHAALSAVGFLILLPFGTLVARWTRVFTTRWFTAHWLINIVLGIPLICVGWALGPLSVAQRGGEHIVTAHQICGVLLFVLYIIEVALGTLVHLRRPLAGGTHPMRNVVHVILGLTIFALSIYETINGVARAPSVSRVSERVVFAICIGWSAAFAGTYSTGLIFLRRQFAQERLGWNISSPVPLPIVAQRLRVSAESVQRRANVDDSPMADDGTHDVFSRSWRASVEQLDREASDGLWTEAEMRQVQAAPVSLSVFL